MKFLELQIKGFGKFHDRSLTFADGINVVYGKNEAGKSTIHTFIRCMLFGIAPRRGKAGGKDLYSRWSMRDISTELTGLSAKTAGNFTSLTRR